MMHEYLRDEKWKKIIKYTDHASVCILEKFHIIFAAQN